MKKSITEEMIEKYNSMKPDRNDLTNPTEEQLYFFYKEKNTLGITALLWCETKTKGLNSNLM